MKYALLNKYSIDDLEEEVNLALSKGWECVGAAFFSEGKWLQTVVKKEVEKYLGKTRDPLTYKRAKRPEPEIQRRVTE